MGLIDSFPQLQALFPMSKIHSAGSKTCFVCTKGFPIALLNEHHIIPRAFGGDDSPNNKKFLCPTCHQSLHRMADLILAKKTGVAKDFASSLFTDPSMVDRILRLAMEAAKWERQYNRDTPDAAKKGAIKDVTLHIPLSTYQRLAALSADVHIRSIPTLILRLMQSELNKRYIKSEDSDDEFEGLE